MGDETYVHYYTPTSKQRSLVWYEPGKPAPKKVKMTHSVGKIITTVFWDWKSILLLKYHPAGVNTTQDTNDQTLKVSGAIIGHKHSEVRNKKILFWHDNARPHTVR